MGSRKVGSDTVEFDGDSLVVRSTHDMPMWKASKHRKVVILFEGNRYTVKSRDLVIGDTWEYELELYPDVLHELPSATIDYDLGYVMERDELATQGAKREAAAGRILFVAPLMGFLPSEMKTRLCEKYGYDPRTVTEQSVGLETALMYVCAAGSFVGMTGILGSLFPVVLGGLVMLVPDTLIRRSNLQLETIEQFGFYEWLFRLRVTPKRLSKPQRERPKLKARRDV